MQHKSRSDTLYQGQMSSCSIYTGYSARNFLLYRFKAGMSPWGILLTHWGWDKIAAIFQTTFSNAFSSLKMYQFLLRFHWSLFLSVQLTIFQHWFRQWFGAGQATRHCLNQWWLVYCRIYASLGLNELISRYNLTSIVNPTVEIKQS